MAAIPQHAKAHVAVAAADARLDGECDGTVDAFCMLKGIRIINSSDSLNGDPFYIAVQPMELCPEPSTQPAQAGKVKLLVV